jgi:hypothetical protein
MMQVYSPLSETIDNETTKEWTYRIRKLTTYAGAEYTQICHSSDDPNSWTYGEWYKTMKNNHFAFIPEYSSGIKIGQVKFDSPTPIVFYVPDTVATKEYVENYVSS